MLNLKGFHGHHGLEGYKAFETHNLGSQVPNSVLVASAIDLNADAILVSQTVTQQNLHISNLTELVEIVEAEGRRKQMILTCGGPRVSNELAKELGYDAGFSKGTYPHHVASFIVRELAARLAARVALTPRPASDDRRVLASADELLAARAARAGRAGEEHRQDRDARRDPGRARGGRATCVGVTSIGRDGEEHDVIDARIDKPRDPPAGGQPRGEHRRAPAGERRRARAAGADRRENAARRGRDREALRAGRGRSRRPERRRGPARGERGDVGLRRRAGADRRRDRPPRGLLAGGRRRARDGHRRGARARTSSRSSRRRRTRSIWSGCPRPAGAAADGDRPAAERASSRHAGAPARPERRAGGDRRAAARASASEHVPASTARSASASSRACWRPGRERAGRELRIVVGDPTKVFLSRRGPGLVSASGPRDRGAADDRAEGDHSQPRGAAVAPLRLQAAARADRGGRRGRARPRRARPSPTWRWRSSRR